MASSNESPKKGQAFSALTADINEVHEALEGYLLSEYPHGVQG